MVAGIPFRCAAISADGAHIVVTTLDKAGKDCISIFNATTGAFIQKITMKGCGIKVSFKESSEWSTFWNFSFISRKLYKWCPCHTNPIKSQ
jgi:hypothetical protein